jgi:hypothetical protein
MSFTDFLAAGEVEVCIFNGIIKSIGEPDLNERKEAVVEINVAKQFHKEDEGNCENYIGTDHFVRYNYQKNSVKEGSRVEYVWGSVENDSTGPGGEMWFGFKKIK